MADLRCSKCGEKATPALAAKPGGTHYRQHAGYRGRNSTFFRRAVTCGTWVEVKLAEDAK